MFNLFPHKPKHCTACSLNGAGCAQGKDIYVRLEEQHRVVGGEGFLALPPNSQYAQLERHNALILEYFAHIGRRLDRV